MNVAVYNAGVEKSEEARRQALGKEPRRRASERQGKCTSDESSPTRAILALSLSIFLAMAADG